MRKLLEICITGGVLFAGGYVFIAAFATFIFWEWINPISYPLGRLACAFWAIFVLMGMAATASDPTPTKDETND